MSAQPWIAVNEVLSELHVSYDRVHSGLGGGFLPAQKLDQLWKVKPSEVNDGIIPGEPLHPRGGLT